MSALCGQIRNFKRDLLEIHAEVNLISTSRTSKAYPSVDSSLWADVEQLLTFLSSAISTALKIEHRLRDIGNVTTYEDVEIKEELFEEEIPSIIEITPDDYSADNFDDNFEDTEHFDASTCASVSKKISANQLEEAADSETTGSSKRESASPKKKLKFVSSGDEKHNDSTSLKSENPYGSSSSSPSAKTTPESSSPHSKPGKTLKVMVRRLSSPMVNQKNFAYELRRSGRFPTTKKEELVESDYFNEIDYEDLELKTEENYEPDARKVDNYDEDWNDNEKDDSSGSNNNLTDNDEWSPATLGTPSSRNKKTVKVKRRRRRKTTVAQDGPPFTCHVCPKVYINRYLLKEHLLSHSGRRDYQCIECDKAFYSKKLLTEHRKRIHSEASSTRLKQEGTTDRTEAPYKCPICERPIRNKNNIANHVQTHSANRPKDFKCLEPGCDKAFTSSRLRKEHQQRTHGTKLNCTVCSLEVISKLQLKDHMRTEHQPSNDGENRPKDFKCLEPGCDKAFTSSRLQKEHHQRVHCTRLHCSVCSTVVISKLKLRQHMKSEHPESNYGEKKVRAEGESETKWRTKNKSRHPCSICKKSFATKSYLDGHLAKHRGERKFQCDQCGRAFFRQIFLRTHLAIHAGEKNFKCDQCPLAFSYRQLLDAHKSRHHSVRQKILCTQCGKLFMGTSTLRNHVLKVHQKDRPHKCHLCSKSFKQKPHLRYHLKTHENPNGRKRGLNKDKDEELLWKEDQSNTYTTPQQQ